MPRNPALKKWRTRKGKLQCQSCGFVTDLFSRELQLHMELDCWNVDWGKREENRPVLPAPPLPSSDDDESEEENLGVPPAPSFNNANYQRLRRTAAAANDSQCKGTWDYMKKIVANHQKISRRLCRKSNCFKPRGDDNNNDATVRGEFSCMDCGYRNDDLIRMLKHKGECTSAFAAADHEVTAKKNRRRPFQRINYPKSSSPKQMRNERISSNDKLGETSPSPTSLTLSSAVTDVIDDDDDNRAKKGDENRPRRSLRKRKPVLYAPPKMSQRISRTFAGWEGQERVIRRARNAVKKSIKQQLERKRKAKKRGTCRYCSKRMTRNLDMHMRIHTGELPYECIFCSKKFAQLANINHHYRMHIHERQYFCKYCDKEFVQQTTRDVHQRMHTGVKPYACNACGKKYRQVSALQFHQHHNCSRARD